MIRKLKSKFPHTPYAPVWDISLGLYKWEEKDKIDTIREFLLSKEEEILDLEYNRDAGTGLGEDSVTTRFGKYNLFNFQDKCSEIGDLFEWLQRAYLNFIAEDGTDFMPLKIISWFNIIKKGQEIKEHSHGAGETGYLSGNMHLDDYPSTTQYREREMRVNITNEIGGLTFFPSYVNHSVAEWVEDSPRVSLAFDLYLDMPPYYFMEDMNSVQFMDPGTSKRLTGPS